MRIFKLSGIRFRDISLKQKLFLCIAVFIVFPLLITGVIINSSFIKLYSEKAFETSLSILKQSNQYFVNIINETENMSLKIISNNDIQKFLKNPDKSDTQSKQTMVNVFRWLRDEMSASNFMDSVSLSSREHILLQTDSLPVVNEEKGFWEEAYHLKGKGLWTCSYQPDTYAENSGYVISFYRAVNDIEHAGKFLAMERISIHENTFNALCTEINAYKDGNTTIVNDNGYVISSADKTLPGADMGTYSYINKAIKNGEGFFVDYIDGRSKVVLYYTIDEIGWHVIQTIPENAISSFKNTINTIVFIAVFLCVLFGILFSIVQNRFVLNPLDRLLREMQKLKNGDFNIRPVKESNDEIGNISRGVVEIVKQLKEMINSVYVSRIKQREAELIALEAQINPHFLHNTLDSIHWLAVKRRDYDVSEQLEALSDMFKHVLNRGKDTVTIEEELSFIQSYIFIQKSRFGDRIDLCVEVAGELYDCEIPKLVLQPLIENAYNHGFEKRVEGGKIYLNIKKENENILFSVIDNGLGADEETICKMMEGTEDSHKVFALKNIDDRIKIKYGENYGLKFFSEIGKGTRVEVLIPAIKGGEHIETDDCG